MVMRGRQLAISADAQIDDRSTARTDLERATETHISRAYRGKGLKQRQRKKTTYRERQLGSSVAVQYTVRFLVHVYARAASLTDHKLCACADWTRKNTRSKNVSPAYKLAALNR